VSGPARCAPGRGLSLCARSELTPHLRWKIVGREALVAAVRGLQRAGKKVVFTNGCFDLLHVGHVRYLQEARALGDALVVGVNSDASVRRLKGPGRPLNPARERAEVLAALASVDYVTTFSGATPLRLIEAVRPDVLVKGGDWPVEKIVGREVVEARGGRVLALPFVKNRSTTATIARMQAAATRVKRPDGQDAQKGPDARHASSRGMRRPGGRRSDAGRA
jgi:D-beta-D-heptose 7-phosphate kinase/D-beta-D-heptose 1-phosphate adenosyltransferase